MGVACQCRSKHVDVLSEAWTEHRRYEPSTQPLRPHLSLLKRAEFARPLIRYQISRLRQQFYHPSQGRRFTGRGQGRDPIIPLIQQQVEKRPFEEYVVTELRCMPLAHLLHQAVLL
ncbi:hypothetical protein D3C76_790790 [compost metagenome]